VAKSNVYVPGNILTSTVGSVNVVKRLSPAGSPDEPPDPSPEGDTKRTLPWQDRRKSKRANRTPCEIVILKMVYNLTRRFVSGK
jgi:hypothetical protein